MSESTQEYRLTEYAHAAGCGCKIAPSVLQDMLRGISVKKKIFPDLIAGNEGFEDAAVMDLGNGRSLISSADFFSPIVDDAFDFGRIAAANAISDVYAMGGKPIMALGILGWPVEKLPPALASKVMEGAMMVCEEANIPLAGGHSIDAPEPFFGLSVNGIIPTRSVKRNHTIQEGDLIYLTKPIGVGILSTAIKRKQISEEDYTIALKWMTQLNKIGEVLGNMDEVHALTDVTGFGLLGHLLEMVGDSDYSIALYYDRIPVIESARHYLKQRIVPDATYRNWNHYHTQVEFGKGVDVMEAFNLLPDPQTNGGLLMAVPEKIQQEIENLFIQTGLKEWAMPIGKVIPKKEKRIVV
jgi:selenide,water dikinase